MIAQNALTAHDHPAHVQAKHCVVDHSGMSGDVQCCTALM